MKQQLLWIVLAGALTVGAAPPIRVQAQQSDSSGVTSTPARQQKATTARLVVTGEVTAIHGRRLFSIREKDGSERDVLVLAPRSLSTVDVGSTVRLEGTLRRFSTSDLQRLADRKEIDARDRARLSGRQVLVASSLLASLEGRAPAEPVAPEPQEEPPAEPAEADAPEAPPPLTISASMLGAHFDELAGRDIRVLKARVVGVIEPGILLVEPATRYLKPMGTRDRIAVFVRGASLRVAPDLLVGSTVTVEGNARSVLGIQAGADMPWPPRLDPATVRRLEVRGALVATSIRSPDGTELTDRTPGL